MHVVVVAIKRLLHKRLADAHPVELNIIIILHKAFRVNSCTGSQAERAGRMSLPDQCFTDHG